MPSMTSHRAEKCSTKRSHNPGRSTRRPRRGRRGSSRQCICMPCALVSRPRQRLVPASRAWVAWRRHCQSDAKSPPENGGPQPLNVHKAPPRRRTTSSPRTCRLPGRLRRGTVRGAQRRRRRVRRPPPAARARAPCLCARRAAHDARREAAPSGTFATCRSWRRSCPWPCQSRLIRVAFWCTLSTPTRQSGLGRL